MSDDSAEVTDVTDILYTYRIYKSKVNAQDIIYIKNKILIKFKYDKNNILLAFNTQKENRE